MGTFGRSAALLILLSALAPSPVFTASAAPPPDTVLVQGQLLDGAGNPVAGLRQYRVRFFDAETDGTQLGPDSTGFALITPEGLFAAPVAIPQAALEAVEAWYEIAVDSTPVPNGVNGNDVFPDRVKVHSVPFARVAGKAMQVDVSGIGDGSVDASAFNALGGVTGNIQNQIDAKANTVNVYDKAAVDAQIALRALKSEQFQWVVANAGPVQAQANRGYVLTGAETTTVTLPPSASLSVGDVVRLTGVGAGGWRLGQNAGQQVLTKALALPNLDAQWIPQDTDRPWMSLASSADGTKLVAGTYNDRIYTSTDSGATWTPRESSRVWWGMASSADGAKLVAVADGEQVYTSTDSGITWTPRESSRAWRGVASSADGSKLVAVVNGDQIFTSTDSGVTWTPRESVRSWWAVASSANGVKLVAVVSGGKIYTSTDSGVTWTPRASDRDWRTVASSANGNKMVACPDFDYVYTSTDSGVTWNPRSTSLEMWRGVASSADGAKLVAVPSNFGRISISNDSGFTWTQQPDGRVWICVASSADGARLVAAEFNGRIYTYSAEIEHTTAGVGGALTGPRHSAVELQYVGNNTFVPLSHEGSLEAL